MKKPYGPYFEGQLCSNCGCYYPDVTRLGDDGFGNRLILCINHGFQLFPVDGIPLELRRIPTDEWREKQRKRLKGKKQ